MPQVIACNFFNAIKFVRIKHLLIFFNFFILTKANPYFSALYSGEDSDPEISGAVADRLTAAAASADGDDEHDSLEGNGFGTNASSPTGNASTSSCSGAKYQISKKTRILDQKKVKLIFKQM